MNRWTETEKAQAHEQGWDVFAVDDDQSRLEIQRIDEMEKFDGDAEALAHVYVAAAKGDPVCRAALEICHENEVKHWTTYNDANHRNRHAKVFGVEFFAFPYQSYSARLGDMVAVVGDSTGTWSATIYDVLPSGHDVPAGQEHFDTKDKALIWAAEQLLKGRAE